MRPLLDLSTRIVLVRITGLLVGLMAICVAWAMPPPWLGITAGAALNFAFAWGKRAGRTDDWIKRERDRRWNIQ